MSIKKVTSVYRYFPPTDGETRRERPRLGLIILPDEIQQAFLEYFNVDLFKILRPQKKVAKDLLEQHFFYTLVLHFMEVNNLMKDSYIYSFLRRNNEQLEMVLRQVQGSSEFQTMAIVLSNKFKNKIAAHTLKPNFRQTVSDLLTQYCTKTVYPEYHSFYSEMLIADNMFDKSYPPKFLNELKFEACATYDQLIDYPPNNVQAAQDRVAQDQRQLDNRELFSSTQTAEFDEAHFTVAHLQNNVDNIGNYEEELTKILDYAKTINDLANEFCEKVKTLVGAERYEDKSAKIGVAKFCNKYQEVASYKLQIESEIEKNTRDSFKLKDLYPKEYVKQLCSCLQAVTGYKECMNTRLNVLEQQLQILQKLREAKEAKADDLKAKLLTHDSTPSTIPTTTSAIKRMMNNENKKVGKQEKLVQIWSSLNKMNSPPDSVCIPEVDNDKEADKEGDKEDEETGIKVPTHQRNTKYFSILKKYTKTVNPLRIRKYKYGVVKQKLQLPSVKTFKITGRDKSTDVSSYFEDYGWVDQPFNEKENNKFNRAKSIITKMLNTESMESYYNKEYTFADLPNYQIHNFSEAIRHLQNVTFKERFTQSYDPIAGKYYLLPKYYNSDFAFKLNDYMIYQNIIEAIDYYEHQKNSLKKMERRRSEQQAEQQQQNVNNGNVNTNGNSNGDYSEQQMEIDDGPLTSSLSDLPLKFKLTSAQRQDMNFLNHQQKIWLKILEEVPEDFIRGQVSDSELTSCELFISNLFTEKMFINLYLETGGSKNQLDKFSYQTMVMLLGNILQKQIELLQCVQGNNVADVYTPSHLLESYNFYNNLMKKRRDNRDKLRHTYAYGNYNGMYFNRFDQSTQLNVLKEMDKLENLYQDTFTAATV